MQEAIGTHDISTTADGECHAMSDEGLIAVCEDRNIR